VHTHPFRLDGKTILVTGASSGIGRQVALSCARMGATIIATGRNEARLAALHEELGGAPHRVVSADLSLAEGIESLTEGIGSIHGVVHSAGVQRLFPVKLLSEKALRSLLDINFVAPVMLTQRLLHRNTIVPGASIVFVSSSSANSGTAGVGPYAASKAALHGLMRCLALEQAKRQIRVNCIVPSAVETPLWDPAQLEAQRARHPLGLGRPDDVANATIFLLSDASRWVTGTELNLDGGVVLVS